VLASTLKSTFPCSECEYGERNPKLIYDVYRGDFSFLVSFFRAQSLLELKRPTWQKFRPNYSARKENGFSWRVGERGGREKIPVVFFKIFLTRPTKAHRRKSRWWRIASTTWDQIPDGPEQRKKEITM